MCTAAPGAGRHLLRARSPGLALAASRLDGDDAARAVSELRDARMVRISRGDHGDLIEPYHDRVADAVATRMPEAVACHPAQARALLAAATRDARRLRASAMPIASVQAAFLEASIAYARGERELAVSRLGETLARAPRMIGPMAALRWRIGTAIGGDAAAALPADAIAALTAMAVTRPAQMVNIWVPGWDP